MSETIEDHSHFFEVRLDLFDGPIDLLLHLVKQNELEIERVSLAQVASQYLECLEVMRSVDLEIAGEYLVIAATLLSIKSSVLLQEPVEFLIDDEGNVVDPHEELLMRLREAAVYKEGAAHLGSRKLLNVDVFSPPSSLGSIERPPVRYRAHDPMLLGVAFRKLLKQARVEHDMIFTVDPVSIVERMMQILSTLRKAGGSKSFVELIPDITSRSEIVSCFISLLELCKRRVISVFQELQSEEIMISLAADRIDEVELASSYGEAGMAVMNGTSNG